MEVLDAIKRHAMIRVTANGHIIMLQVAFPENYPSPDSIPDFIYCQGTTIDDNLAESLVKVLKATASHRIKRGRTCLEQCLRALVSSLKKVRCATLKLFYSLTMLSHSLISFAEKYAPNEKWKR